MEEEKKEDALIPEAEASQEEKLPWYFQSWSITFAIFAFGPLGLLFLWFRPRTSIYIKAAISIVVIGLTVWLALGTMHYYRVMMEHFQELAEMMQE
ncbi:MAG: hypothetical protein WBD12_03740 [Candidatus Omnitrophota bacterium]